jgi:hypothetical protein
MKYKCGSHLIPARSIHSLSSRFTLRYPRGFTVHVARPSRSILLFNFLGSP